MYFLYNQETGYEGGMSDWRSDVCSSDLIAVQLLTRPEKRNALDNATVLGLQRFFAAPPAGVKVVVLDGQGDHFSAGLDLSATQELSATEGVGHSMMWHEAFRHRSEERRVGKECVRTCRSRWWPYH